MSLRAVAAVLGLATANAGAAGECPLVRRTHPMMATYVTISVRSCEAERTDRAIGDAFAEMQRLADLLSEWNPDSPVSQVSAAAGVRAVAVPPEVQAVLKAGKEASAATGGAFDVTWAALAGLWKFDGSEIIPSPQAVERQRALVGDRDLLLDEVARTAMLRRAGMRLGLGGLAKGYIAQAGADLLVAHGLPDVLVAASGDITARGRNGDRNWSVAIQDPRSAERVLATVDLLDESVSTAGDYEHAFVRNGRRYHHILDPRTGMPAQGAASVSVVSKRGVWADALDTGLLVMGLPRGGDAADRLPEIGALLVAADGHVRLAGVLGARFVLTDGVVEPRPDTQLAR